MVSKNDKFTVWKRGRPALSDKYRDAKEDIYKLAKKQWRKKPLTGKLTITMSMYMPDHRRRDILNYTQLVCDGVEGVIYEDDSQIDRAVIRRMKPDKDNPRVEITVKETGNGKA